MIELPILFIVILRFVHANQYHLQIRVKARDSEVSFNYNLKAVAIQVVYNKGL